MKVRERHNFRVFRILGKVSYEIRDFQSPLESFNNFQGFQGLLDTLKLRLLKNMPKDFFNGMCLQSIISSNC